MIVTEELSAYRDDALRRGRHNVEQFFASQGLDKAEFEKFVLERSDPSHRPFYVSTVARGLASGTSDIDIMLVADGPLPENHATSNMLFFQQRRVGLKLLSGTNIETTLDTLESATAHPTLQASVLNARLTEDMPVRWVDLERIINGVPFSDGESYHHRLATLCGATAASRLKDYLFNALFLRLAVKAGLAESAYAYGQLALMAAMDVLMASCGHVQSNMKWIFERWSRFAVDAKLPAVREGVALLTALHENLDARAPSKDTDQLTLFEAVNAYFEKRIFPSDRLPAIRLALAQSVRAHGFLPNATSLHLKDVAAVVGSAIVDHLQTAGTDATNDFATPRDAATALRLLQHGFLCAAVEAA